MPELGRRRRLLILGICCMSVFIVGLDSTIVNVALPSIQVDLHAPVAGLQWTVAAYTLVLASLLMFSGATADRIGRRRIFQVGLAIFVLGSVLCSLAPSLGWLIAFRMLQAVGGSMLNPVALSIVSNTFTDAGERTRAIGIWDGVFGLSMVLGPVVGGTLVDAVGWRGIFAANVPVGGAAALLAALFVPESRAPRARRPDPVGQVLLIVLLGSLTYSIIQSPGAGSGSGSARILASSALAAAALAGLVAHSARAAEPVIDFRVFRSVPFAGATLTAVCAFAALGAFLFLNTLYLQEVRGFSALGAGLRLLPMAVMMTLFAPLSGRILAARGARMPMIIAGAALSLGAAACFGLTDMSSAGSLFASFAVFGIGIGMVNSPITNAAVSGMPRAQAGLAAGIGATCRQIGQLLGVAVAGSVLMARTHHGPLRTGFVEAIRPAWLIVAGCGYAVLLLGIITTSRWASVTAARTAATLAPAEPELTQDYVMEVGMNRDSSVGAASGQALRTWRAMRALVLDDDDRREEACAALRLNFIQVRALLELAMAPLTVHDLAVVLGTDVAHAMLVVCDLEGGNLATWTWRPGGQHRRTVALTATGITAAETAESILGAVPEPWHSLTPGDLRALDEIMAKLHSYRPPYPQPPSSQAAYPQVSYSQVHGL